MARLAVLLSGSGSNFQALLDNDLQHEIVVCVSNRKNAYGLERAKKAGIDNYVIKEDDALLQLLKEYKVDYIILAGYLKIVSDEVVAAYREKILNIHPSLIPSYSGLGYYGMKIHEAVIENKDEMTGVTIHLVNEGVDTGCVLTQERVYVNPEDTPSSLADRVLEVEHSLYYQIINQYVNFKEEMENEDSAH